MNVWSKRLGIALTVTAAAALTVPMAADAAGLLSGLLSKKTVTTSTPTATTTTASTSVKPGLLSILSSSLLSASKTSTGVGLDSLLSAVGVNAKPLGTVYTLLDKVTDTVLFTADVGGITYSYINIAGNLLNALDPLVKPILDAVVQTGRTVTRLAMPTVNEVGAIAALPLKLVVNDLTPQLALTVMNSINSTTGGEIRALIPMPLDPKKTCEECHGSRQNLIMAMTDVVNNIKYPGLAGDVLYVDNFYVQPDYAQLPDSMMSKASKTAAWDGCKTCHGSGSTFDPFPSDNWVPRSNPNDGPDAAKAFGTTNDTSKTCGKCHAANAAAFNKGIMGTHRGHLWAFNYNDVEIEGTNTESNFFYDPFGSYQAGTDLSRLPLDRNGKRMHAGYFQARGSCSSCHQSCSDCHMTGPGDSPTSILAVLGVPKIDPTVALAEFVNVDRQHITPMVRLKAMENNALRRGGVNVMELRKGYRPGISRGVPYTPYQSGMDVATHKIHRPTTAEQGNVLAPQTQQQSIDFCWRCHFRTAAEFQGNWINVVPNLNYPKSSLGHLNAGMTCTDCHKSAEVHGYTSAASQSFAGTYDSDTDKSHPGGNPVGSTPKWDITPNPIKVTCGLCHTDAGKKLGPTGGLKEGNYGQLVTPRYQQIAKLVKGFATMPVPGKTEAQITMSHKNVKCEACHTQAMQNCWNCHLQKNEALSGLPLIGTNTFSIELFPPIVNVREAEGEPALTAEENALLREMPLENDAATLSLALTFPNSPNTVNKSVRFLARNHKGQVGSVVHCPGGPSGINNPDRNPQPRNLDGGLYQTKEGVYGQVGSVGDVTYGAEGSWYMEPGHSIARSPDGEGFESCYNCHADTVRLGQDPITYYRKNPWIMKSIGAPEAIMPGSHFADKRYLDVTGRFNCNCHSPNAIVHNGSFTDGPWQLDILPKDEPCTPGAPNCKPAVDPCAGQNIDGAALYAAKCAACHLPLASSTKKGRTADAIKIGLQLPFMSNITLTECEINAIADALK